MDSESYNPDTEREFSLLEVRSNVYGALKERDYPLARRFCRGFGEGPEISRLGALIELTAGNLNAGLRHLDNVRLAYLGRTEGAPVAERVEAWLAITNVEITKSRAYSKARRSDEAISSYNFARKYYNRYFIPLATEPPEPFGIYYQKQIQALEEQDQDLRPEPNPID